MSSPSYDWFDKYDGIVEPSSKPIKKKKKKRVKK